MFKARHGSWKWSVTILVVCFMFIFVSCAKKPKETIVFSDPGWDSAQVHSRVAAFIIENGMGYTIDYIPGETIPLFQGTCAGLEYQPEDGAILDDKFDSLGQARMFAVQIDGKAGERPFEVSGLMD